MSRSSLSALTMATAQGRISSQAYRNLSILSFWSILTTRRLSRTPLERRPWKMPHQISQHSSSATLISPQDLPWMASKGALGIRWLITLQLTVRACGILDSPQFRTTNGKAMTLLISYTLCPCVPPLAFFSINASNCWAKLRSSLQLNAMTEPRPQRKLCEPMSSYQSP